MSVTTTTPQTVSLTRNPNLSAPKSDRSAHNEVQQKFGERWWTGLHPEKCVGFDREKKYLAALPLINLDICTRQDVLDYFDNTWTLTEILFAGLKHESTYIRPPYHQLRHPLMFYYGHPAVLFLNKLRLAGVVDNPVDLYLEKILETGVDEMSWDDMAKNEMEWPNVATVHEYRQKIYNLIKKVIQTHPDLDLAARKEKNIQLGPQHPLWSLFMGFEHEKIHFETSSVLMRELPIELVETPKYWAPLYQTKSAKAAKPVIGKDFPLNTWSQQSGSLVSYGKAENAPSFGWDNEYGHRNSKIKDFQLTEQLISNGEYFDFVASGAYQEDKYWQAEGLMWRKFRNTKRPTFWVAYGPEGLHDYKLRTIFEIIDMPWDWPAEVNFHEAQAYCRWKQEQDKSTLYYRLITEAEFASLKLKLSADEVLQNNEYKNLSANISEKFNFNFHHASPRPVNAGSAESGVKDLMGNVWQWAEDQFNPLEGFKINKLYDDFSTPCFDGKHQMILGGSFISCGHEASINARFHFRPHFFQHAGFRMAATLDGSQDNAAVRLKHDTQYVHAKRENVLDQMQNEDWWKSVQQPMELSEEEIQKAYEAAEKFVRNFEHNRKDVSPMGTALDPYTNDIKKDYRRPYQTTKNFPETPESFEKLVQFIASDIAPLGQQPGHPGYMAYVAGAANPLSAPAQALAMTMNQFTGHFSLAPGLVTLEMEVIRWFTTMMKYSEQTATGILTGGGSQANMMALVAARNKLFSQKLELSKARFYASTQVHHCIGKAIAFLGFPKECLRLIATDQNYSMIASELDKSIAEDLKNGLVPVAVVGTAGTTNTGSVDPLDAIADICEKNKIWFHVDGAYGALFMLTDKGQKVLSGIERSQSVALDPHKALQIPYGVGCLLIKNKSDLSTQYAGNSSYMPPSPGLHEEQFSLIDFADISPELSRDPRGLRVWLPLKAFGVGPFKLNLEEKIQLSDYLHSELKKISIVKVVSAPHLTIQSFNLGNTEKTKKLLAWINSQNKIFLSGCEIGGCFSIRVCLLGYRLHFAQVQELIQLIKEGLHA